MSSLVLIAPSFLTNAALNKLIAQGERLAAASGTNQPGPKFPSDPSYIPVKSRPPFPGVGILAIDVGGTHIRVGLRTAAADGHVIWQEILEIDNNLLKTQNSCGKGLDQMAHTLSDQIMGQLSQRGLTGVKIAGAGVVWSNQIASTRLTGSDRGIRGVSGVVCGSREGKAYRKGEWWNRDISDGDNVGEIFIKAFRDGGLNLRSFVIGNDTVFTCKAIDYADAGMVASTGANATIVPAGGQMLCNSESGGNFEFSAAEIGLQLVRGQPVLRLEDAIAGKNLPAVYAAHLVRAAEQGVSALSEVAALIQGSAEFGSDLFSPRDISQLVSGKFQDFIQDRDPALYPTAVVEAMRVIAKKHITTAGQLAAAMAYFSIYNQLPEREQFGIALDSSQARFQPGYFEAMQQTLAALLELQKRRAIINLLDPEGEISVPMIGVARAANDFLWE